jgi:hypothetical protein
MPSQDDAMSSGLASALGGRRSVDSRQIETNVSHQLRHVPAAMVTRDVGVQVTPQGPLDLVGIRTIRRMPIRCMSVSFLLGSPQFVCKYLEKLILQWHH